MTAEAIQLFRQGFDMLRCAHDRYDLRDLKIKLAAALGRSKFAACPLDLTSFFRIDKAMSSLLFVASAGRFTGYDPG
jgi:hypothetical protein